MTKYFLTGVTGRLGRAALSNLLKDVTAEDVIVGVRDLQRAPEFEALGVTVRQADYTKPETLTTALAGVDKLLLVSGVPGGEVSRFDQHRNVIDAAKAAGVTFIVYTSLTEADQNKTFLAEDHANTETYIATSGLAYAIARNNWYLENELDLIKKALAGEDFSNPVGDAKIGWALNREYGEAAAKLLTAEQPQKIYEFGGRAQTYADLAQAISSVSGRTVKVIDQPVLLSEHPDVFEKINWQLQQDIAAGVLSYTTDDLAKVLGREPLSLTQAVQELVQR
ncbi:SDR family oxidoreductase [Weissella soli]|uniref:SDR family oxidoreductase n=1 Tax=Weissella soli TaxID=155866 RepID=UPI0021BE8D5A|nr:SDR family oxidoreductase [Weissella soli]MCT8395668.1 SDR family oxidoreductase [Weissella soli]